MNDVNDDPTAIDDQLMALKDFVNQELDVLPNDSIAPDVKEDADHHRLGSNLDGNDGTTTRGWHRVDLGGRQEDHLHARGRI